MGVGEQWQKSALQSPATLRAPHPSFSIRSYFDPSILGADRLRTDQWLSGHGPLVRETRSARSLVGVGLYRTEAHDGMG